MSIHEGHRKRIRELFLRGGLDVLNDHQVLELLLFYTNPRTDVNPIAHRLMETFGTLAAVLDAPYEELLKVEGVGENTAVFCKLLPQLMGRYQQSQDGRREIINSVQRAGEVIRKCFVGQTEEVVYLHCLDAKGKVLGRRLICRGSVNSASVSPRKLVETAMAFNASGVILSHNHTSGLALPSRRTSRPPGASARLWPRWRSVLSTTSSLPTTISFRWPTAAISIRNKERKPMAELIYDENGRLLFTKEMKQEYTILFPQMLPTTFRMMARLFEMEGYKIEMLNTYHRGIVDTGLKYVHNDTCYPALLVIGQLIDAVNSGKYDKHKVALLITQTGGGCRASNYIHLLRKALVKADLAYIPVISLNLSGLEKNPGFQLSLGLIRKLIPAMLYGDLLIWLGNQCRPTSWKRASPTSSRSTGRTS